MQACGHPGESSRIIAPGGGGRDLTVQGFVEAIKTNTTN